MIPGISSVFAILTLATPFLLLVMLVPALLELKKPKDAGPRSIMPHFSPVVQISKPKMICLLDLDERHDLDISLKPFLAVILDKLTDLEI
jgi:hypothetical protein